MGYLICIGRTYDNAFNGKFTFQGYIYPYKADSGPQFKRGAVMITQSTTDKNTYKGFRESWWATYQLKEFDKIAPDPGVNWSGNILTWLNQAVQAGWKTTKDIKGGVVGCLLICGDSSKKPIRSGYCPQGYFRSSSC